MLLFFDDDSLPKIRRSIFAVCATITFIAHFSVGLRLPTVIFDLPNETIVIEPETSIMILGVIWIYLFVRYATNYWALLIRFRSGLDRESDVAETANHYKGELEKIRSDIATKLDATGSIFSRYEALRDDLNQKNSIHKSLLKQQSDLLDTFDELTRNDPDPDISFIRFSPELMGTYQSDLSMYLNIYDEQNGVFRNIDWSKSEVDVLLNRPEISNFDSMLSAEARSDRMLGRDQFGLSVIAVILASAIAGYSLLQFFVTPL